MRNWTAVILLSFLFFSSAVADQRYEYVRKTMSTNAAERKQAAAALIQLQDLTLVPPMVDAIFFTPKNSRQELTSALRNLTHENAGNDYYSWVEILGRRNDIKPDPDYLDWKTKLLSRIDPHYKKVLRMPMRIRVEEIVWGGVPLNGIPSLEKPETASADKASYLQPNELVFGLEMDGESRAYPLRILSWHEMTNDVLAGNPITLSF